MGKILDTLRYAGQPARPETLPISPEIAEDEPAAEEEMPFIEVGPRRSFEASASVRATIPDPLTQPMLVPLPTPAAPPAVLPRPHNVLFRSLAAPSRFAPDLVAFHAPGKPESARYGELLHAVTADVAGNGTAVLLFTAVRPEVGATTVLLNVAITAAREGRRLVVVDANLRKPGVAVLLGLESAPGLTEVLAGDCDLEQGLRLTEQANLVALTAGSPTPMLSSVEALGALLKDLRGRFDLVLVDGPRWDGRPGVVGLASVCDAVFLVAPGGEADAPPASELVRTLPEQGVRLAGCILTGA